MERATIDRAVGWDAWRERWQGAFAAASVLVALGLWGFAFLRVWPSGAGPSTAGEAGALDSLQNPWEGGFAAIERSASPETLAELARATPGNLSTAIDDSLFGELGKITQDASRAARFLVGRLPASLVTRATEATPR